jgi:hypothetical protein
MWRDEAEVSTAAKSEPTRYGAMLMRGRPVLWSSLFNASRVLRENVFPALDQCSCLESHVADSGFNRVGRRSVASTLGSIGGDDLVTLPFVFLS